MPISRWVAPFDRGTARPADEDQVDVIDSENGKLLGTIADTPGVHGVAIAAKSLNLGPKDITAKLMKMAAALQQVTSTHGAYTQTQP